jgi:hypothetical protein
MYILQSQIIDGDEYESGYEYPIINVAVSDKQEKLETLRDARLRAINDRNSHIEKLQNLYDRLMQSKPIPYLQQPLIGTHRGVMDLPIEERRETYKAISEVVTKNSQIKEKWHLETWIPVLVKYCDENGVSTLATDIDIAYGKILPEKIPTFTIEEIDSV